MKITLTPAEVDALNRFQHSGQFHPYTCGGNRTDANHLDGEGILVATADGWVCPYCDYRQEFGSNSRTAIELEGMGLLVDDVETEA